MPTIDDYGKAYNTAKAKGDKAGMAAAHAGAEKIRASQGYSGGADGSKKIPLSNSSNKKPGTSTPYGGYKTPEEYVAAINRVEASGGNFQNKAAAMAFKAANPHLFNTTPNVPTTPAEKPYEQQINNIYDPLQKAQLAKIKAAKEKATGQLNLQRQGVTPQYNKLRGQADVVNAQNAQRLREVMASQGLANSGENVTATVGLNASRQNSLNDLNLQEQSRLNEIDQSIADVNNADDEAAIIAQINAERARALYDAANRSEDIARENERWKTEFDRGVLESDRGYNYQVGRDKVADEQHAKEFAEDVRRYGLEYALKQSELKLSQQREGRIGSGGGGGSYSIGQRTDDLFKVWQQTGVAPAGLEHLGVAPGTKVGKDSSKFLEERGGLAARVRDLKEQNGNISVETYNSLRNQINEDLKLGFYTSDEAEQLLNDLSVLTGTSRIDNRPKITAPVTSSVYGTLPTKNNSRLTVGVNAPDLRNYRG